MSAICDCPSSAGAAPERIVFKTSFTPDKLGARTTLTFSFKIAAANGGTPAPLTNVDLLLPAGIGLATSTLGLANCSPAALLADGLEGCSANARIGYGQASVAVPYGADVLQETATVGAVMGPPNSERLEVLFYAEGHTPLAAQLIFPGEVLAASGSFSGRIDTNIPLIPTLPGGPDVSVTSLESTIGPSHLTYYERVHGEIVPYTPQGIAVPKSCPRGGFPFAAEFSFQDGTAAIAKSAVPCPRAKRLSR